MSLTPEIEVAFQPHGKRAKFPPGVTAMKAAQALGVDISSLCAGQGKCGKCKVRILGDPGTVSEPTDIEMKHLSEEEIREGLRLACTTLLGSSTVIHVPLRSRIGSQRLQTAGLEIPVRLDPLIKKYRVTIPPPHLRDSRADEDRLLSSLVEQHSLTELGIDLEVYRSLPNIVREAEWDVTAVVWKDRIIALEPGDTSERCYGLAVDVGTTKLAGYLIDLKKGDVVSVAARMNPQIPFGEDVMSRVSHIMSGGWDALDKLQDAVASGVNEIIEECCDKSEAKPEEIYELNFVGNTVMQLLLLGVWPRHVVSAPYTPAIKRGVDVKAASLGINAHPGANAHHLPVIGGFVGADNVAMVLASGILESEEMVMAIDVGTNTEIDLGNRELVMADSCASGPAFEGMQIKFGMRATAGSIEKIGIDPETLDVYYRTIGDAPPIGICGSGIIDAPAEFLKSGLILPMGNFVKEMTERTDRLRKGSDGWEFVIAWGREAAIDRDIVVTLRDIRELQKAKAAIHTGADLLMQRMEIQEADISRLVVAGAFGNYIDPENARIIGMYPEIPLDRIEFAGNLAGTGAKMTLMNREMRELAEEISSRVKYHELAADESFQKEYIDSLSFPHTDLSKYPEVVELLRRHGQKI
jgi:uncharacterized 2Fe-2S/4Fe-4S cluster protein (DUF4445 family)